MSAEAHRGHLPQFGEPARATTKSYRYLAGFEFGQKAIITGRLPRRRPRHPGQQRPAAVRALHRPRHPAGPSWCLVLEQRLRLGANFTPRRLLLSQRLPRRKDEAVRNTYVYGLWQLTLEFDLPLRFIGRVIGGWQSAEYQVPIIIDGVETLREDRLRSFGGSLLRRLGRNARFGLTALHTTRTSNVPGLEYSRWQYGIQGSFTP